MPQIYDMRPTVLLPHRRKACRGFKFLPHRDSIPGPSSPLARRYTVPAIPYTPSRTSCTLKAGQ